MNFPYAAVVLYKKRLCRQDNTQLAVLYRFTISCILNDWLHCAWNNIWHTMHRYLN